MQGDGRSGSGFVCQGTSTQKLICSDTLSKHARQNSHGGSYGPHSRFKGHMVQGRESIASHTHARTRAQDRQEHKSQRRNVLSDSTFFCSEKHLKT